MKLDETETKTVKQFIVIVIILALIAVAVYFITAKFVNNSDEDSSTEEETTTEYIDPTKAIVGTMLNKSDGEYYVILYSSEDSDASTYKALVTSYKATDNALNVYTVDLSNYLNQNYVATGSDTNPSADNLSDLRFGTITVIKVKENKIVKAYEGVDAIKKVWKLT